MNVVDSSAWLSYFAGDHNAGIFAQAIEDTHHLLVPSITITEIFKHICRQRDEASALTAIAHMEQGRVIALDSGLAVDAASFGIRYKLPLADSIIFATAHRFQATLWTQDSDFNTLPNVKFYTKAQA